MSLGRPFALLHESKEITRALSPHLLSPIAHPRSTSPIEPIPRMGLFSDKKPYTAISSDCEALMRPDTEPNPSKLVDLIELIQGSRPQSSGTFEAGRLMRKKLKYGTPSEQRRALSLAEALVDNGIETAGLVADSGLADQLVQLAAQHPHTKTDHSKGAKASRQCRSLLHDWSTRKDRNIQPLFKRAGLVDKHHTRRRSTTPDDDLDSAMFGADGEAPPPRPRREAAHRRAASAASGRFADAGDERPSRHSRNGSMPTRLSSSRSPSPVNLRGSSLDTTVATAHNVATRLTTALIASPHGSHETEEYYRQGKQVRQKVVKLIHNTSSDVQAYIGPLINANEELVEALQAHDAVMNGEPLESRNDHDLLNLDGPDLQPLRPPPSMPAAAMDGLSLNSRSDDSSPEPEAPREEDHDEFDPFADDFEQAERPKHTPLW